MALMPIWRPLGATINRHEIMNFEITVKINELIHADNLDKAIQLAEDELNGLPKTDFHKIIGRDLLSLTNDLNAYVNSFYNSAADDIDHVGAIYCEMNGFTINYDLWFIDLFAFKTFQGLDDIYWLAEWDFDNGNSMTISGLEDIQEVFQDYMENEKWKDDELKKAFEVCEILIILRLQQLFRQAAIEGKSKNYSWAKTPILVTAHDCDLIYNTTRL